MKLEIENFAKIKKASINLDGITVIAGPNNSGKSTVGKILYSLFNAGNNIKQSVINTKKRRLKLAYRNVLTHYDLSDTYIYPKMRSYLRKAIDALNFEQSSEDVCKQFFSILNNSLTNIGVSFNQDVENRITEEFNKVLSVPNDKLARFIVSQYFRKVFNEQINNIENTELIAKIQTNIKNKNINLEFKDDELISMDKNIDLVNLSTYIDNPFVLDKLSQYDEDESVFSVTDTDLLEKLSLANQRNDATGIEDEALSRALISNEIQKIIDEINVVIPGTISYSGSKYVYRNKKSGTELDVKSLSTGIKSIAIIKQLLLNQKIKERDVLILDEPEVHLHPEWQLKYAELIVLLQKAFDLTIVVTTHSSHFLEALDLYSKIYKTNDKCSYYLAASESNFSFFENVTEQLEKIYSSLVSPNFLIDKLKEKWDIE